MVPCILYMIPRGRINVKKRQKIKDIFIFPRINSGGKTSEHHQNMGGIECNYHQNRKMCLQYFHNSAVWNWYENAWLSRHRVVNIGKVYQCGFFFLGTLSSRKRHADHWNWQIVRATALLVTGDTKGTLQRPHRQPRQSLWWPFCVCATYNTSHKTKQEVVLFLFAVIAHPWPNFSDDLV